MMTVEDVIKKVKETYGKDITEEQAKELMESSKLSDEDLEKAAGGTDWRSPSGSKEGWEMEMDKDWRTGEVHWKPPFF